MFGTPYMRSSRPKGAKAYLSEALCFLESLTYPRVQTRSPFVTDRSLVVFFVLPRLSSNDCSEEVEGLPGIDPGRYNQNMKTPAKRAVIYLRVSTAKQASTGGEAEGYSIPAQRGACQRKAEELGAAVVEEYVDAGASARSIDRPALQELLDRLIEKHDVDYVIVHKVDRLARDRADDVAIGLAIHKAALFWSQPPSTLMKRQPGLCCTASWPPLPSSTPRTCRMKPRKVYTRRPSAEARLAMRRWAPLNVIERFDGKEVKAGCWTQRAPHVKWAFET